MTKCINMARRSGKTTLLINASFVTGAPIVVYDNARKAAVIAQAKDQGLDVQVYTLKDWIDNRSLPHCDTGVLIDEADLIIEKALECYLYKKVIAYTISQPIIDRNKKEE